MFPKLYIQHIKCRSTRPTGIIEKYASKLPVIIQMCGIRVIRYLSIIRMLRHLDILSLRIPHPNQHQVVTGPVAMFSPRRITRSTLVAKGLWAL